MKHRTPAKLSVASVSCRYHPVWYDSGSVREASNREREPGCCELVGGGGEGEGHPYTVSLQCII